MLRVRTFFQGFGITFTPKPLNFTYGTATSTTETQYGAVVGYDSMTTLDSKNYYVLNGGGAYATNEATLSFKTTQPNQRVTIEVRSSSQSGDYMCAGVLDSDSITKAQVKVSGTQSNSYTYTVPTAGNHYIKFFFRNDASGTSGNNKGYFRLEPFTNTVQGLTGLSKTVEVKALSDWQLYSKSDWITSFTPQSSTKGKLNATVNVNANYGAARSGNVTLQEQKKGKLYTLQVNQEASPSTLKLSNNYVVNNDEATTNTITVALTGTSTTWTATNTSSSWYSISPTTGKSGDTVTITWKANTGSGRTAQVVFTGNNGGTDTLTLQQENYICACDCVSYCQCDIDVDCPADYTNACTCNTVTSCTCDDVCSCNSNRDTCSSDGSTCSCNSYSYCSGDRCSCNSDRCNSEGSSCSCNSDKCNSDGNTCTCNSDKCTKDGSSCSCNSDKCSCDSETCSNDTTCSCNRESCVCDSNRQCNCDGICSPECPQDCMCYNPISSDCLCWGSDSSCPNNCLTECACEGDICPDEGVCGCYTEWCHGDGEMSCTCESICSCNQNLVCSCEDICGSYSVTCSCDGVCSCNSEYTCSCDGICSCNSDYTCTCDGICSCNSDWTCSCESYCSCDSEYSCVCEGVCSCDYDRGYHCTCETNQTTTTCTTDVACSTKCSQDDKCSCDNYQAVN